MAELHEALVAIVRARDRLLRSAEEIIRGVGLSEPQFNVLRILRGAGEPLPTSEVGRRMITRVPDITRLVDRLEKMGLVCRKRAPEGDRRVVFVEITAKGLETIAPLDNVLEKHAARMFEGVSADERARLVELLERVGRAE
jgi:DNA-binding MarR family transcriptional regulator